MQRWLSAAALNVIGEHPDVKPWLGYEPDTVVDLSWATDNPANYCLMTDDAKGGYLLISKGNGVYEAHSLALPEARGSSMLRLMHDGFEFMFLSTDCVEITTMVPDGNPAAEQWSRFAGFRPTFRREGFFPLFGEKVGGQFLTLSYFDWVGRAPGIMAEGAKFHMDLESLNRLEPHPDDEIHDRWVGATILGIRCGNILKCVALYNRWSMIAGYQECRILSATPPLVDIGDAVIQMSHGHMDVLKVRQPPT
jgi:hypothetical protein